MANSHAPQPPRLKNQGYIFCVKICVLFDLVYILPLDSIIYIYQ